MAFLHEHDFKVIAFRDLARYVDPNDVPADPRAIINTCIKGQKEPTPQTRPAR